MRIYIVYLLLNMFPCDNFIRNGDFSNRIVLTTSREEDPETWFDKENTQFQYIGQMGISEPRYIKAMIRPTADKENINPLQEDPAVDILRQKPEIVWVEQEKFQTRIKRKTRTNDPEWDNLWYLNDDVSPSMKVTEAWSAGYSGKHVRIAVVDDGIQTDHPDISANIDEANGRSFRSGTTDPNPTTAGDSHGTQVVGLIAAVKDNRICIPGVAFNSTVIAIQLLDSDDNKSCEMLDSNEADALNHNISTVDIYTNSWGPLDGEGFHGPGKLTVKALYDGVTIGREGKGAIYVFASGNGGKDDNCNADGYSNSIYTIAITSVQIHRSASYSEICACALAATYGGSPEDKFLTTTAIDSKCTSKDVAGTSFSAPIASGIIALTLEANPDLTWRDIQHIIVATSSGQYHFIDTFTDWSTNGANIPFSKVLGFGLMNAELMTSYGEQWETVPQQQTCSSSANRTYVSISTINVYISAEECSGINYLEHVLVHVNITLYDSLDTRFLWVLLNSPNGTKSVLLNERNMDSTDSYYFNWTFMSVHFWGENPIGNWILEIFPTKSVTNVSWTLTFYGTTTYPWSSGYYNVKFVTYTYSNFTHIQAMLYELWTKKLGKSLHEITITELQMNEIDQHIRMDRKGVDTLIQTCYDLINDNQFKNVLNVINAAIELYMIYRPNSSVIISNETRRDELCSIRTILSPCGTYLYCDDTDGKPSCVVFEKTYNARFNIFTLKVFVVVMGVFGSIIGCVAACCKLCGKCCSECCGKCLYKIKVFLFGKDQNQDLPGDLSKPSDLIHTNPEL